MSFSKRYEIKRRKEVVGALRNIATRINQGELDIVNFGLWRAMNEGDYSLKMDVRVSDKFKEKPNS